MKSYLRNGAIALALLAGTGIAAAQTATMDARLQLTESQKEQIYRSIAGDPNAPATSRRATPPPADVNMRVGAALPSNVELLDLPAPTVTQVPAMARYKYVVFGDEVAIVDPGSRQIVEILRN